MTVIHKTYIVGAGCGSKDLLTLKAYELITNYAEIVIYDRLIADDIIELIPPNVEKIYAGKSCKHHFMTQAEINDAIILAAKAGKKLVRLKGGDPFIFGRAGEEILELKKNNLPFEVVPGISAASGISAEHLVPLTHRNTATSVIFLTGHKTDGEFADINWDLIANEETTIVIYMGLKNIEEICYKLIKSGLSAKTPILAVQDGTMQNVKTVKTTIDKAADIKNKLKSPVTIFIGKVVDII